MRTIPPFLSCIKTLAFIRSILHVSLLSQQRASIVTRFQSAFFTMSKEEPLMLINVESVEDLHKIVSQKNREHLTKGVKPALLEEVQSRGWSIEKQYKRTIQMKK